jgi:hypothetical protein
MNFCDDLHSLSGLAGQAASTTIWDSLLATLTDMVLKDTNLDWSKPATRALLQLCGSANIAAQTTTNGNTLTCGITIG